MNEKDYLEERLQGQIEWYNEKSQLINHYGLKVHSLGCD